MTNNSSNESLPESEHRYRSLRSAVADYHYHVEVDNDPLARVLRSAPVEVQVHADFACAAEWDEHEFVLGAGLRFAFCHSTGFPARLALRS